MSEREQRTRTELADALAEALQILDERGETGLEEYLAAHPALAAELRERLRLLEDTGMLGDAVEGAAPEVEVPRQLGEFVLGDKLGSGGMGVVYRASQPSLGREVALKLVRPEHLYFPQARERFRREVEAVARLEHEGIVRVYAAGEDGGVPYFVMERVEGVSLDRLLTALRDRDWKTLDARAVRRAVREVMGLEANGEDEPRGARWSELCCRWLCDLALAVDHAHRHGVLHRDLKPSNVMVTPDLTVKLLDFGLASTRESSTITRSGSQLGSVPYMAPEQLAGGSDAIDERTDVYGLGVTFYELLTLRCPFLRAGDSEEQTRRRVLDAAPLPVRSENASISWDAETVCAVAMEQDPQRRYASAADLARDLHNVLALRPIEARRAGPVRRLRRLAQRRPAWAVGIVLGTMLLVVGPLAFAIRERILRDQITEAQREAVAELETQKEILTFLNDDLLAAVDPSRAGREASMREVLDLAAQNIEGRFPERPHVEAAIRQTIGHTYTLLGALAEAEPHMLRAVELFVGHYGTEHAHTLEARRELASLYQQQDRLAEAEEVGRQVVAALESSHGPEDAETLNAKNTLGLILIRRASYEEAEEILLEVVETRLRVLGEEHRHTLASMANLGLAYFESGRHELAEPWWRRELAGSKKVFPPDHPDLLISLTNWANVQLALEHLDEARAAHEDLVERTEAVYGPRHPETILSLFNLGVTLTNQRDFAAAEVAFRDGLARGEDLPPEHRLLLSLRLQLVAVQMLSGRTSEALVAVDEVLYIHRGADEPNMARIVYAENLRASVLIKSGAWKEAEAQCRQALDTASRAEVGGHELAKIEMQHGMSLRHLERYGEAADALQRAHELLRDNAPRHRYVAVTCYELAATYETWGKSEEAAVWRREAEEWTEARAVESAER